MTIMTQLSSLVGALNKPTLEAKPTDLEIALARVNADHKSVLIAVKMLTEIAQSNAAANLDMAVVHEERNKGSLQRDADLLKSVRELKKEMMHSDNRHLAAYELAVRPMTRAINDLMDKVNGLNADIHTLKTELHMDREAQARIQNTKLNAIAIAIRIDALTKLLAKDLIKHPKGVTVAPAKKDNRGGKQPGGGRRKGVKDRPAEVRYAEISNKLQRCRAPKARAKFMATLVRLRAKMGMAPMSDRALGNIHARTAT
jgi:hypothetical protein